MLKSTALALVLVTTLLVDAKRDSSRLLLQTVVPQGPPVPPPPPGQGVPQSQGGAVAEPAKSVQQYNPYGQQYNPMNNMNNPYCNPISGQYDLQDCLQYGAFFGGIAPSFEPYGHPGIVGNPGPGYGYIPGFSQPQAVPSPGAGQGRPAYPSNPINSMNLYCNPYSGMYDIQDCYEFTYGFNPF